jgi:hypothetical protein
MHAKIVVLAVLLFELTSVKLATADFLLYTLPGAKRPIILEGKTKMLSATIMEFAYPGFPAIAFNPRDVDAVKAPSRQDEFKKFYAKAQRSKTTKDFLEAARLALQRGMLKDFYQCCSEAYKLDPKDPTLTRLIEARKRIKKPLGTHDTIESELRAQPNLPRLMKTSVSAHYVMLHDTSDSVKRGSTRAQKRLELLENVYESYFMKFALDGVVLEPPTQHMMVLLFADEGTYLRYATSLDPDLKSASGFWSPKDNIGVFYDQGTTEEMKELTEISEELNKAKLKARKTAASRDVGQLANSLDLLLKIAKEEADVEVVSHEATHQLAGNTGLMPRNKLGLRWAHEGLASYFETPAAAGWGGVGAVNETRLIGYKRIARIPELSKLEFLVSDTLFDAAATNGAVLDAYGYSWALTHYLMENRFSELVTYYRKCSELAGDDEGNILRKDLVEVFNDCFGDPRVVEREFHAYMGTLKTDVQRLVEAAK